MTLINENYLKLKAGYLFPEIARRVNSYIDSNPGTEIIKLGIGDVTEPLTPAVVTAFHEGVREMGEPKTFRGYGPGQGYDFLKKLIAEYDFKKRGVDIRPGEIYVSDGAKCDTGNMQEIFAVNNKIAIGDPVYPVYLDTNVMAGRSGVCQENGTYENIIYMPCTENNNFIPELPQQPADIIYLCFPNNPTGSVASRQALKEWVDYARQQRAVILFDAAYEAFITDKEIPHSIYEVEGAKECAVEFRSLSKTAGFTGTRLAYTVVPDKVKAYDTAGKEHSLAGLWQRRQNTKFNGVSYPVQKAAAACFSDQGQKEITERLQYYLTNAALIKEELTKAGHKVYGGINAPYLWMKTPDGQSSWQFFDTLLHQVGVVGTPGAGFGCSGEGYFRFSAFGSREKIQEAMERITAAGI